MLALGGVFGYVCCTVLYECWRGDGGVGRRGKEGMKKERTGVCGYSGILWSLTRLAMISIIRSFFTNDTRSHPRKFPPKPSEDYLPSFFLFTIRYCVVETKIEKTGYGKSLQMSLRYIRKRLSNLKGFFGVLLLIGIVLSTVR